MNNIYSNIIGFVSSVRRMSKLLSVLFLLTFSASVFGDVNIYGLTSKDKICSGTYAETHPSGSVFSLPGETNYYIAVYNDLWVNLSSSSLSDPDGLVKESSNEDYGCGDTKYYFIRVQLREAQSVVISYSGSTLTISKLSWRLCGEFTDWAPAEAPEFSGSGSVVSLSVYFDYTADYECATDDKGFKVVSYTNGAAKNYYGRNSTKYTTTATQNLDVVDGNFESNCGIKAQYSGTYIFTFNTSTKDLTVTYPDAVSSTPVVRWGAEPQLVNSSTYTYPQRKDIEASAYIASTGCSGGSNQTIDSLKVRYWIEGSPDDYEEVKFTPESSYSINNAYTLKVPCNSNILASCKDATNIVMTVAGHNSVGWSALSDEMEILYTAPAQFILHNLTPVDPFTGCDNAHQFTLSDMVMPVPTSWSVAQTAPSSVPDAKSDFTLKDGVMIWNNTGKAAGSYAYTFTFARDGYDDSPKPVTATISFTYDATAPTGEITNILVNSSDPGESVTETTPWIPVPLSTTIPEGSGITKVQWSVSGVPAPIMEISDAPHLTATFEGKPFAFATTYTVTAKGLSSNCVATAGKTVKIKVNPDAGYGDPTIIFVSEAPVVENGPEVTLSGYVKRLKDSSVALKKRGFLYKEGSSSVCSDGSGWSTIETTDTKLDQGDSWNLTINSGLKENTTYCYKPFVYDDTYKTTTYSVSPSDLSTLDCGTFTTQGGCEYPTGDTIYYTIDASLVSESTCKLEFKSFESALANLKSHKTVGSADYWWNDNYQMLAKNVVFLVAVNKAGYGVKNSRIDLKNINKYESSSSPVPTKRLVIRPLVSGTKPIIYGLDMDCSRWVTVNSMNIKRDSPSDGDGKGNSCILIGRNLDSNILPVGQMTSSDLVFVNCVIEGDNFCCIHANGIDGLYLENNNLIANCTVVSSNTRDWGASIKLMNSKNVTLLRNNFKGAHSNNIFSQNTQDMLVMNNVFWNENVLFTSGTNKSAIIRLLNYETPHSDPDGYHNVKNIAIYYNTLFLEKRDANTDNVDFLIFGGAAQWRKAGAYDISSIEFQYNNCYSYSTTSAGKTADPFIGITVTGSMEYNNFWSAKTGALNGGHEFEFGGNILNHSMAEGGDMICTTSAHTPEGMVVKGHALDLGSPIISDVSGLSADTVRSDRLDFKIRPNTNKWTYGAYQSRDGETVDVIIWNGGKDANWDDRNNWVKENGRQVTCIDHLSDDLKVIIPEPHSHQYPLPTSGSITRYPTLIAWTTPSNDEKVRAGINAETLSSVTKFAHTIEMEYGSAIGGVENLKQDVDNYHYHNVQSHLTVDPKEWVLVGSVVRPFVDKDKAMAVTDADTTTRLTQSGDFYLYHKPHVYMQKFDIEYDSKINVTWGTPFTDLKTDVEPTETFAISVADQFGDMKLPASFYYALIEPDKSKLGDGDKQRTFDFNGHYYAAEQSLNYTVQANSLGVFNNAYPANIDGSSDSYTGFNLYTYDYKNKSWEVVTAIDDKMIKPQSGFAIYNTTDGVNTFTPVYVTLGDDINTKYKSASADASVIIRAYNIFNDKGSRIGVGEAFNDAYKLFNGSVSENLEVYMLKEDGKYSTLKTDDFNTVIPIGVSNKSNSAYPIRFELLKAEGVESVILEDRGVTPAATYDLLSGEAPAFPSIEPCDLEGRFYLMLGAGTEENPDIPTDAPAESADSLNVDVFVNNGIMTVSVSADAVISSITMYDMAGKAYNVPVGGTNMNKSKLNVAKGVYTVTVVTDKGTETKKIVVK